MAFQKVYLLIFLIYTIKCQDSGLYLNVATVEYQRSSNHDENLKNYLNFINDAKDLDLIVFPEATLCSTNSPSFMSFVDVGSIPYKEEVNKSSNYLNKISQKAMESNIMVIININEKEKCNTKDLSENCKKYQFKMYNTDVIIDWTGKIIAKYRKYHLFGEYPLDITKTPELVTFKAKNSEIFGIFTCFDILFKSPAMDLIKKQNIKNIVYPTMWYSELPFLTAIQTQQMWSMENDVFLISSGANEPSVGSGGTGIYLGANGVVSIDYIAKGGLKLYNYTKYSPTTLTLQNNDDIDALGEEMDNFHLLKDNLSDYAYKILNGQQLENKIQVCHNGLCCNFTTTHKVINKSNYSYDYFFVAYNGIRDFSGIYYGGIEICALIACPNSSIESCGTRLKDYKKISWNYQFERIEISAEFDNVETKAQFPNTLLSSIRPLPPQKVQWNKTIVGDKVKRTINLKEPQNRLMTFGIFGRNFEVDHPPSKDNSNTLTASLSITSFILFLTLYSM